MRSRLESKVQVKIKLFPISRFIVYDRSMVPSFNPGDHVLTWNWGQVGEGDVVVFGQGDKYFIKRIDKFVDNYVYISGDNRLKSSKMKPVKREQIVGKVILKY